MINYLKGDATQPVTEAIGPRTIIHICNNRGGWGAGFVMALSKRWREPEYHYREWFKGNHPEGQMDFELGAIQVIGVESNMFVINMIAQEGYGPRNQDRHQAGVVNAKPPIRYDALDECLGRVAKHIGVGNGGCSVHLPRIGCGLAGGHWGMIQPLLKKHLDHPGIEVNVYDL